MIQKIQDLLNDQIKYEASASMQYLAMASWADHEGFAGVAEFFYAQSEEEKAHMTKLVKFVNERGGKVNVPALDKPLDNFKSLNALFEQFLKSEMFVTEQINHVIFECYHQHASIVLIPLLPLQHLGYNSLLSILFFLLS